MKSQRGRKPRGRHGDNQDQDANWSMSMLPHDVTRDILMRLPLKTIIQSRGVCRTWRSLLSDSCFSKLQRERAQSMLVLRSPSSCVSRKAAGVGPNEFYMVDLESAGVLGRNHVMKFNTKNNLPTCHVELVGSCNGLLCLFDKNSKKSFYLCSPMTGEICIFGEDEWKSIGEIPFPAYKKFFGVSLNGALHWIVNLDDDEYPDLICALDIDIQRIRPMSPPNGFRKDTTEMSLGVLRDRLFICDNMTLYDLDIWVMKDYGIKDSWTKEIVITKNSLSSMLQNCFLQPVMVSKDGKVLISSDSNALVWYDPTSKSFTDVTLPSRIGPEFEAVCCVASFDSLSDIMKKNAGRIYVPDKHSG
ncbi:unnamed protein product [Dovyalis caffra]|uniref:F-box domain-containing protein n=1 Tax=Dovyalis caffra TaxID=77055 RepID=A0AAV1SHC3_9ROSI|nr:unnamed protein product [Dovyalis caffra]